MEFKKLIIFLVTEKENQKFLRARSNPTKWVIADKDKNIEDGITINHSLGYAEGYDMMKMYVNKV